MITVILIVVALAGGFFAGILVGRKNAKTVANVVSASKAVASDVKKV